MELHTSDDLRACHDAALAGRRVVRLKGGDPAIFGRTDEKVRALHAAGVKVRICPGITTTSAAAASAGISLSLRGIARRVQLVTAHSRCGRALDVDWPAPAAPGSTLAFCMGRDAAEISRALIAAGACPAAPVVVACDVSLATERMLRTGLDLPPIVAAAFASDRPTLILVGEAVSPPGRAVLEEAGAARLRAVS
mgnify:CR=1 FL=1